MPSSKSVRETKKGAPKKRTARAAPSQPAAVANEAAHKVEAEGGAALEVPEEAVAEEAVARASASSRGGFAEQVALLRRRCAGSTQGHSQLGCEWLALSGTCQQL